MTGDNLKAALNSSRISIIGGLIGVPITISGNSIPVGLPRGTPRADMKRCTGAWWGRSVRRADHGGPG